MKAFRTISAMLLAILLLVSSTSFMVGIHVCGGEVRNVALFKKADGCEKEQPMPPCHRHSKASCCEDETMVHTSNDFKSSTSLAFVSPFGTPVMLVPFTLISEVIPSTSIFHLEWTDYGPPLPSHDLTVEHQVFLI